MAPRAVLVDVGREGRARLLAYLEDQVVLRSLVRRATDGIKIGLMTQVFLTLRTTFCVFLNRLHREATDQ